MMIDATIVRAHQHSTKQPKTYSPTPRLQADLWIGG